MIRGTRTTGILACVLPPLFCLIFYWYGLKCWFRQDDFAWLHLAGRVHDWPGFWRAMFAPMAQGTIRPWSERAYFMGLYTLFGLHSLPFRLCVFATQFANLTLIQAITRRLTGSAAAGFWAAMLWISNAALITVMTWSSVYNQALSGFFLLLAFYFLLRYIETGRKRFNAAQWLVFLFGFGALEVNAVYPAVAAAYTLLCAPRYFRRTLPLFLPSIAFTWIHRALASPVSAPLYEMRFDSRMWTTLKIYLSWAAGPGLWPWGTLSLLIALAVFAAAQAARGRRVGLFFAAWFFLLLLPVLPLPFHLSEYYLTLPTIGLAMLGGWALDQAWRSAWAWKMAAAALLVVYLSTLAQTRVKLRERYEFSLRLERVVLGVEEAHRLHPGQVILLRDVDDDLFWQGLLDRPFDLAGVPDVYLAPESEGLLTPHPELGDLHQFLLPAAAVLEGINTGKIVVYSAAGERLKNITISYPTIAKLYAHHEIPRRVDVANELLANLLGPTWYRDEENHRWMPKRATVRLGGPTDAQQRLYVSGYCASEQWELGPLPLSIAVDGKALPTVQIQPRTDSFAFDYALPADLTGKESVEITVEAGRTFRQGRDKRELGLAFGVFEIR